MKFKTISSSGHHVTQSWWSNALVMGLLAWVIISPGIGCSVCPQWLTPWRLHLSFFSLFHITCLSRCIFHSVCVFVFCLLIFLKAFWGVLSRNAQHFCCCCFFACMFCFVSFCGWNSLSSPDYFSSTLVVARNKFPYILIFLCVVFSFVFSLLKLPLCFHLSASFLLLCSFMSPFRFRLNCWDSCSLWPPWDSADHITNWQGVVT
jgi:hypothetical protein